MTRALSALLLAALAAASWTSLAGCDDRKRKAASASGEAGEEGPTSRTASEPAVGAPVVRGGASAAPATSGAVWMQSGCAPITPGGNLLAIAPGALSMAVARGRALVVSTVVEGTAREADAGKAEGIGSARAERLFVGAGGVPEGAAERVADGLPAGAGVLTFASATALSGELTTLTYATRRPAPSECAEGVLVAAGATPGAVRRELQAGVCRPASFFRGAARGTLGIALVDGAASASRLANAWVIEGSRVLAVEGAMPAPPTAAAAGTPRTTGTIDAPAVAVGDSSVAWAYVVVREGVRELHVARAARGGAGATGTTATRPTGATTAAKPRVEVLEKKDVGTVTLAFDGDALHVVWSALAPGKSRYALRWSKWPEGGAPQPAQTLGTGVMSAAGPALAIERGRFLMAWVEGDDTTTIKAGASRNGVAAIAGLAAVVSAGAGASASAGSAPGGDAATVQELVNAREPFVGLEGEAMIVGWKEIRAKTEARVRASALRCLE